MDEATWKLLSSVCACFMIATGVAILAMTHWPRKPQPEPAAFTIEEDGSVTVSDNVFFPAGESSGIYINGKELTNENVKRHSAD